MPSIVIDDDVTFSADIKATPALDARTTPLDMFSNGLPETLRRLTVRFDKAGEGTVLLSPEAMRRLGLPDQAPADVDEAEAHPWLTPARERGWTVKRVEPWMTFSRKGNATVHLGCRPWMDSETFELMDPDPAVIAYRMEWIAARMHTAYRARPGVVGTAAVPRWVAGRTPLLQPKNRHRIRPIAVDIDWERPYVWHNPIGDALIERDRATCLHGWDVRSQFLAAASLAELPREPLSSTGPREFDPSRPGYWRVVVPWWGVPELPHPIGMHDAEDLAWVTTPRLALVMELADAGVIAEPVILDSWTADRGARLLRPWAENIRDGIAAAKRLPDPADALVLSTAMKHTYTHAIDMWAGEKATIRRRDWTHTIKGVAGSQFWRKLYVQYKADGRTPVKVYHDMAYYTGASMDAETDRPSTFTPSEFMGRMRYKHSEVLAA